MLYENPEIIFHTYGHRFPFLGLSEKKKTKQFLLKYGFQIKNDGIEKESRL